MALLLSLCVLLVITASFRASSCSSSSYRELEPPFYDGFANVTRPDVNVSIINICTCTAGNSTCRAVCGEEPWGTRVAWAICKEFVDKDMVLVSARNFTLPENLTRSTGRSRMDCTFEESEVTCAFFAISRCPSGRVAALFCQSKDIAASRSIPAIATSAPIATRTPASADSSHCPASATVDGKGIFGWSRTRKGTMRYISCNGPSGQSTASRRCNQTGGWEKVDTSQCSFESRETERLHNLSQTVVTESNVVQITTDALKVVGQITRLTIPDVHLAVSIYDNVVQQSGIYPSSQVYTTLTSMTGIILSNDPKTLYESEILTRSSSRAVTNLELTALNYKIPPNRSADSPLIQVQNILVDAINLPADIFKGVTFSRARDNQYGRTNTTSTGNTKLGISLPKALLDSLSVNETNLHIQFIAYNTSSFFQERQDDDIYTKPSPSVLASSVGSQRIPQLIDSVEIRFDQFLWDDSFFPRCVFWDSSLSDGHGGWSESGCKLIETTDEFITCSCNHLTSFSALMTLCTSENEKSNGCPCKKQNEVALSLISLIGCAISAVALVLTIVLLIIIIRRKKRGERYSPAVLQLNLCLALLLGLLFFILATQSVDKDGSWCVTSAALLQYFLSSTVLLMMFEAIGMYRDIVLVFHSGKPSTVSSVFMKIALIIAWGVPALVVLILSVLDRKGVTDVYGLVAIYRHDRSPGIADGDYCWLQNTVIFLSTFAGPIILIELFNIFVAVRIYFTLKSRVPTVTDQSADFKRRIRSMLAVTSLLGLTLIFGAVTLIDSNSFEKHPHLCNLTLAFHYLFAIFNSLLGLFVFVFTVLMSSDRRQLIVNTFCKRKRKRDGNKKLLKKDGDYEKGQRSTLSLEMSTLPGRTLSSSLSDTTVYAKSKQPECEISEEIWPRDAQTAALY